MTRVSKSAWKLVDHWEDQLHTLVGRHLKETGSRKAERLLQRWTKEIGNFIQICPKEMLDKLPYPISKDASAIPAE